MPDQITDYAAQFRADIKNVEPSVVLAAAKKHLMNLRLLPVFTENRDAAIHDVAAFIAENESEVCYLIFESGCAKWIMLRDGKAVYTSNKQQATVFVRDTLFEDISGDREFDLFAKTMRLVPFGHKGLPTDFPASLFIR